MKKENQKEYYKGKNKTKLDVRLTTSEHVLLVGKMKEEDWANVSGYIKFKLFGLDYERGLDKVTEGKNAETIGAMLRDAVLILATKTDYFRYRYEKDMNQLYEEEGVDVKKWIDATNKWRKALDSDLNEVLKTIRQIAKVLQLDEYFHLPSSNMHFDPDHPSKEEMDKLAEQLRIEKKAMGYGDEL